MIKDAKSKMSVLDDLIAKCEDSEMSPFKKKRDAPVIEAKADDEGSPEEESKESPDEEAVEDKVVGGDDKEKLDGMDLEELLRAYQAIKG